MMVIKLRSDEFEKQTKEMARRFSQNVSEQMLQPPFTISGTPDECTTLLKKYYSIPIDELILILPNTNVTEQMECFMNTISPSL